MAEGISTGYVDQNNYGQLFMDTYLKTHQQRMNTSIALAERELKSRMDLLQYYQKKEKQYLDYIEEVGTAGASGRRTSDKTFERYKAYLQLKMQNTSDADKRELQVIKFVESEFTTPPGATGSIKSEARKAALNLGSGKWNQNVRAVTGYTPGTTQALAAALDMYANFQAEANATGNGRTFRSQASAIRDDIAATFGVAGMNAQALMVDPTGFQKVKTQRADELKREVASRSLGSKELDDLAKMAGVQVGTGSGPGASQTAQEQEDFLASRLKEVQAKMSKLESEIEDTHTAEDLMRRARQIYSSEFKGSAQRKKGKAAKKKLSKLTPEQNYYIDAIIAANRSPIQPNLFNPAGGDLNSTEGQAYQIMNAILQNKGSGKPLDVASLASKMAGGDQDKAKLLLGLAFRGVIAEAQKEDPIKQEAEQQAEQDAADRAADGEKIVQEEREGLTAQKTQLAEEAKTIEQLLTTENMTPEQQQEVNQARQAFFEANPDLVKPRSNYETLDAFPGQTELTPEQMQQIESYPMAAGTPEEQKAALKLRLTEYFGTRATPQEIDALVEQQFATPEAAPEPIRVPLNTPLKDTVSYNYIVVGYNEDGSPIFQTTFKGGKTTDMDGMNQKMIEEAMEAYEKKQAELNKPKE